MVYKIREFAHDLIEPEYFGYDGSLDEGQELRVRALMWEQVRKSLHSREGVSQLVRELSYQPRQYVLPIGVPARCVEGLPFRNILHHEDTSHRIRNAGEHKGVHTGLYRQTGTWKRNVGVATYLAGSHGFEEVVRERRRKQTQIASDNHLRSQPGDFRRSSIEQRDLAVRINGRDAVRHVLKD